MSEPSVIGLLASVALILGLVSLYISCGEDFFVGVYVELDEFGDN
jgi:hypothetical protein